MEKIPQQNAEANETPKEELTVHFKLYVKYNRYYKYIFTFVCNQETSTRMKPQHAGA